MEISKPAAVVLLGIFYCHFVLADTDQVDSNIYDLSLQELGRLEITIATGNGTPLDKAPSAASVIYAHDIELMGARTLDDLLELIPGLHVAPSSLSRLESIYYIRGIHAGFNAQVLLMLNGVPIQNPVQGGKPTLFRLPATSIDRVEVIRGPGSAIYGADAFAGVINVITKDASNITHEQFSVDAGSFNSQQYSFAGATHWNDVDISLVTTYQKTDGDDSRKVSQDLQSRLDQVLGTNASLAPGMLSTGYEVLDTHLTVKQEDWHVNLWHWATRNAGVGVGGAQALDPDGNEKSDLIMADFTYDFNNNVSSDWQSSIKASYFRYKHHSHFILLPPGALVPIGVDGNINFQQPNGLVSFTEGLMGNPGGFSNDGQLELVSIYQGFNRHRIRVALGMRQLTVTARETKNFGPGVLDFSPLPVAVDGKLTDVSGTHYIFLEDQSRRIGYISLQDEWQLSRDVNFTAGVRYDDYSDFGSTTNPRLAFIWVPSNSLVTKLMIGSAFRAPSFMELYGKNNPVSLGNTNLAPEKINSQELSFNWQIKESLQTILTLFHYRAKDLISFESDPQGISKTAQNAFIQDANGFEWEVNWQPVDALRMQASYSWHNANDQRNDQDIPDAPQALTKLNVIYQSSMNWVVSSQVFYVADRPRRAGDTRKIDDYLLANLTLKRQHLVKNIDASVTIKNIFDRDIREPSKGEVPEDYPMESRSIWMGLDFYF